MPACGPGDTRPEHHQSLGADPPEPVSALLAGLTLVRWSVLCGLFFLKFAYWWSVWVLVGHLKSSRHYLHSVATGMLCTVHLAVV